MYLEGNRRWLPRTEVKTINWARRDTALLTLTLKLTPPPSPSPIQGYDYPDDPVPPTYEMTPGFIKPCTVFKSSFCDLENVSSVGQGWILKLKNQHWGLWSRKAAFLLPLLLLTKWKTFLWAVRTFKRLLKTYEQLFFSKRQTIGIVFAWEVIYYFILWLLFFMWWVLNGLLKMSFSLTVRSACANPGNIFHGSATFNSTSNNPFKQPIWTTVTYTCDSGYQRIGDKTRQCRPNGQWSGESNTKCKSKNV